MQVDRDMNQDDNCPAQWCKITSPKKLCLKHMQLMCSYTHFYAKGVSQEHIGGKGKTYQKEHTDAFHTTVSIDIVYVEDTFFTLGSLQKHVWTYASGLSDNDNYKGSCDNCPCATNLA